MEPPHCVECLVISPTILVVCPRLLSCCPLGSFLFLPCLVMCSSEFVVDLNSCQWVILFRLAWLFFSCQHACECYLCYCVCSWYYPSSHHTILHYLFAAALQIKFSLCWENKAVDAWAIWRACRHLTMPVAKVSWLYTIVKKVGILYPGYGASL